MDRIGGDLELRNHNLCLLVNNKDPILPQNSSKEDIPATATSINQENKNADTEQNTNCNKKAKNQVNFITSPNHILATPEEIEEAKALHKNAELKFNNLKHLFKYEKEDANKYRNLYKRTKEIMNEFKYKVFALHTYDRKTMKLKKAVRLGLKEEYRNVTHYLEQYPLNKEKKLAMINETIELDKNGFWIPIETSKNNIPYTVIAKKPDAEGFVRHRAAFDARSINKFCELIQAKMPTMRNFDDFYSRPGLVTLADFKNFFDCIPLHEDDWQFAVVQTPLGLRMMTHCSYGWKNSAPNAQNITNEMSARVKGMMGYIDDIAIKHDPDAGTEELIAHLRQFFQVCEEFGVLLHPEKFFPFAEEVESLGIKRTRVGSEITEKYRKKVLALKKPTNTDELRAAVGVIQYIARYIYMYAMFAYWLVILLNEFEGKSAIKWTAEAEIAWDTIKRLVAEAPILHHPTREGKFCIKCDGCPYGVGAVLYQWQFDARMKTGSWKIIDMFSKIIPQSQRYNHCIISEALAVLWPAQHWVIYLLPKPFIVSTDHKALLKVFKDDADLTNLVQKQLLRIRLALADFNFEIRHVPGIDNKLPDILSRFGAELVKLKAVDNISAFKASDNKLETLTKAQLDELNQELKRLEEKTRKLKFSSQINNITAELLENKDKWQATLFNLENAIQNERKLFTNKIKHFDSKIRDNIANLVENEISSEIANWDNLDLCIDSCCITELVHAMSNSTFDKVVCTLEQLANKEQSKPIRNIANEIISKQCLTTQYLTRSKLKAMKEESEKLEYIDPDEKELEKQIRFRQDFLDCINKYKMSTYIFETKTWIGYQDLDQQCQLIKRYLQDKNTIREDEFWGSKLKDLENNETNLYNKLIGDSMSLTENGLIEVKHYRELDKKISNNLFVPLKLRKEITQYAHHNPYTQHFGWQQTFHNLEVRFWWPDMKYDARK